MKINFNTPIMKFDGTPVLEDAKPLTFLSIVDSILNLQEQGKPLTAEQKQTAYQIGMKMYASKKETDLTVNQVAFLKERMGVFASPLAYGRFLELIGEGQEEEKKE